MLIERNKRKALQYTTKAAVLNDVGEDASAEGVLDYILGTGRYDGVSEYILYEYERDDGRTVLNRFNTIWITVLFIPIMPIQWLLTGRTGVNRNSKIGQIIDRLVKLD